MTSYRFREILKTEVLVTGEDLRHFEADDLKQFEVKSSYSGLLSAMVFNMETQVVQPKGLVTVNNLRQFMVKSSHSSNEIFPVLWVFIFEKWATRAINLSCIS